MISLQLAMNSSMNGTRTAVVMRVNISCPSRMCPMLICLLITKFYGLWSRKRKGDRGRLLSCNALRKPVWLITRSEDIKTRLTRMMSWRGVFRGEWKHFRSKRRVRRKVSWIARLINTSRLTRQIQTQTQNDEKKIDWVSVL